MSLASFSFSSTIWSLDSKMSMASSVNGSRPYPGRKSRTWHMVSRSTITSIGPARGRDEVHLPVAVEVVEPAVRLAAAVLEERRRCLAPLRQAGEVHVLAGAQARRQVGREHPDGQAAEQLEPDAGLLRGLGKRERLGQRIVGDGLRRMAWLCHGCSRCVLRR